MSISDNISREQYIVQSGETEFTYKFKIYTVADIVVIWIPADDEDNPVTLTYPTDYTVSGIDDDNGGTITLTGAQSIETDDYLLLIKDMSANKLPAFDYVKATTFDPLLMDRNTDKLYALHQQERDRVTYRGVLYAEDQVLTTGQNVLPKLTYDATTGGEIWRAGVGDTLVAATLEDEGTLRSELADDTEAAAGAKLIGYYDSNDTPSATTVSDKLDSLHGFTPPISSDISIVKDSSDNTKLLDFDVSAITTATTRTITMPDEDVSLSEATTTAKGIAEIATQEEVDAGTDTTKFVTPATLAASIHVEGAAMIAFSQTNIAGSQASALNLGCTKSATGVYDYTFGTARSSVDYLVISDFNPILDSGSRELSLEIGSMTTTGFTATVQEYFHVAPNNTDFAHTIRVYAE